MDIKTIFGDHNTAVVEVKLSTLQKMANKMLWSATQSGAGWRGLDDDVREVLHVLHQQNERENELEDPNHVRSGCPCGCGAHS